MNILGGKIELIERKMIKKSNKTKMKNKKINYILPEIKNVNNLHRNKSSKGFRKNLDLIEEFIHQKRLSLKLSKDFAEKNRKSASIYTNDNLLLL